MLQKGCFVRHSKRTTKQKRQINKGRSGTATTAQEGDQCSGVRGQKA